LRTPAVYPSTRLGSLCQQKGVLRRFTDSVRHTHLDEKSACTNQDRRNSVSRGVASVLVVSHSVETVFDKDSRPTPRVVWLPGFVRFFDLIFTRHHHWSWWDVAVVGSLVDRGHELIPSREFSFKRLRVALDHFWRSKETHGTRQGPGRVRWDG